MKYQNKMLINGQFVNGEGNEENILNPVNAEILVQIKEAALNQVRLAVDSAEDSFNSWGKTTPAERSELLLKLADKIDQNSETLARLESLNCGKPFQAALEDELPAIVDTFRFFAGAARCMTGSAANEYLPNFTSMIRRDPIGVVGSITPWNYPLMMAAWKIAPAIAAGNTVVLKPSEMTPLSTLKAAEYFAEIFPPGVINIIVGRGNTVGAALASHPKVRLISLTGDISTGKKVLQAASDNLKKTHLELGGKAPVIVFDDADLKEVIENVRTFGYYNAGQDCTAPCRIYASAKIYENLVADLSRAVSNIKSGGQDEKGVEMGPLISERQQERVAGFVKRAAELNHIEITTGGQIDKGTGFFFQPTVIAGALQEDEITQKEVFGPVVSVTRFTDPEQAIDWANDSEYGLASSVWSKDIAKAMKVSARLQYGCTWINTHFMLTTEMPHGGLKASGYGKDMSVYALEDYTVIRHVMINLQ